MIFFCPYCFREITEKDKTCTYCGKFILEYDKRDFEEKLINALKHPVRDTVERAVWILGKLKAYKAVNALIDLFNNTDNTFLKRQILESLYEIDSEPAKAFIISCLHKEKGIVRKKALELMEKISEISGEPSQI